jgi:FKBP-type peptidyl-prolyl cis-trans isomerase SlyD
MAGKTLKFVFSIDSLRDATDEEIDTGVVGGLAATGGCGCGDGSCGG